jgi:hypothetical protein
VTGTALYLRSLGPLRLLDGDFPNRAAIQDIAEHNLNEALALLAANGDANNGSDVTVRGTLVPCPALWSYFTTEK